jgi:hypothetical protein
MTHPIGSPYVRDQIPLRTIALNEKRHRMGEYLERWEEPTALV